jgi:hypothetical protein
VKFHAFQSLFLFITYLPIAVILSVIDAIAGWEVGVLSLVWWLLYLVPICVCGFLAWRRGRPPALDNDEVDEALFSIFCYGSLAYKLTEQNVDSSPL